MLFSGLSVCALAGYEEDFQARAAILTTQVADVYTPPGENSTPIYNGIGDPEKYVWPKVIARYLKYPNDSWSHSKISLLASRSPFHFTLVGMARIMPLYDYESGVISNKTTLLTKVWQRTDGYNAWTGEGTENHVGMCRTSGYIYAAQSLDDPLFPDAEPRMEDMKNWILYWARQVYQSGTGEWDSSTYTTYNLIGWLNLYDFAPDEEVRDAARAVLDYYSTAMALKYTQGVTSGSEQRGGSAIGSTKNATDYLGWLWFGDTLLATPAFSGNDYIQLIHAVTSTYRPSAIAVALARKTLTIPAVYYNSKPSYLLNIPSETKEIFYIGKNFTLGSCFSPTGGWTGGDNQVINWKLAARATTGSSVLVMTGNGAFRKSGVDNKRRGQGRNPWDQFVQHRNVLIQMTRVPAEQSSINTELTTVINNWRTLWAQDFSARFPGDTKSNPISKISGSNTSESYIAFPSTVSTIQSNNIRFVDMQGTYVAIRSLNLAAPSSILSAETGRSYVRDTSASLAKLCGFVVEVGASTDHESFDAFKAAIIHNTILDKSFISSQNRVVYTSLSGDVVDATFQTSGSYTEPDFDWGYGPKTPQIYMKSPPYLLPTFPSGAGHGRLASWSVNGTAVNLGTTWPVYSGPNVLLENRILKINDGATVYEVDYSGTLPVFREYPKVSAPPEVTITSPSNGSTYSPPADILIEASAVDSDGTITKVDFFGGSTLLATDTSSPYSVIWRNVLSGRHILLATATDDSGGASMSGEITVIVSGPPAVQIVKPDGDTIVDQGDPLVIGANASDDTQIAGVEFFLNSSSIGVDSVSPYQLTWNAAPFGTYSLTAIAQDDTSLTSTSAPVAVIVNGLPTVQITSPANGSIFTEFTPIPVQLLPTDPENSIVKVELYDGQENLLGLANPTNGYSLVISNLAAGFQELFAVVYDSLGAAVESNPVHLLIKVQNCSTVDISLYQGTANESGKKGWFMVTRSSERLNEYLNVNFTVTGSATSGGDYRAYSGNVLFFPGKATLYLPVIPLNDNIAEDPETVCLTLKEDPFYSPGTSFTSTVDLLDNEPRVQVQTRLASASEAGLKGQFLITRTGGNISKSLVVYYAMQGTASEGVDYLPLTQSVTIPAGVLSARVNVWPVDDLQSETSETVIMVLENHFSYKVVPESSSATLSIEDNDPF